jgi:MtfA peptidase
MLRYMMVHTMFALFRHWRRQRILAGHRLDDALWQCVVDEVPVLAALDDGSQARLRELCVLFLHEKVLEAAGGITLDDAMRLRIAALACLPILRLDLDRYHSVRTVIVYPDAFVVRDREQVDEDGVVHTADDVLSGEAWEHGPVVLAWEDVLESGQGAGYNVVVHEFAHKLDYEEGAINGMPLLHRGMDAARWATDFQSAYDALCEAVDSEQDTWLDPYASESPAEFFAVCSELFFEMPAELRRHYPQIYEQLAAYYRQQPAPGVPHAG